nr:glycosyltransferase family protein [Halalkalibaculum roseum]
MAVNTLLITQARTGSSRLPGKVLKKVVEKPLLQIHLDRLNKCKNVSEMVVATTLEKEDQKIDELAKEWGYHTYRGSEEDVLDRFYCAAKPFQPKWVVRVTSDCPLLDPTLVDEIIDFSRQKKADYVSNTIDPHYPDGQDVEVFTFKALEKAWKEAEKHSEREHVTPYIRNNADIKGGNLFKALNYSSKHDYGKIRMTVDQKEDFILIEKLIERLGTDKTWKEYADYILENNLASINNKFERNEGFLKSLEKDQ